MNNPSPKINKIPMTINALNKNTVIWNNKVMTIVSAMITPNVMNNAFMIENVIKHWAESLPYPMFGLLYSVIN